MTSWFFLGAVEAATSDGLVGEIANRVGVSGPKLLSQIILFVLLAYALKRFAFNPIQKVLDERRQKIAESLENAERIKQELEEADRTRADVIAKANQQATQMIEEAQKSASLLGERKLQEAVAQAEGMLKKAQEAIVLERQQMMAELKREIGRLVIETTSKVSGKVLSAEDQRCLNEETLRELAA
ncbi:MAG: F0F1 ATP synthase subunit B [Verrucomicrobiia bacterium]